MRRAKMKTLTWVIAIWLFIAHLVHAGELEDLRKDLTIVQQKIGEEEARYQAAKLAMERSQLIAIYLFPELRKREGELMQKIQKLEAEGDKKPDPK